LTIWSRDVPHEKIVDECLEGLHALLCGDAAKQASDTASASQ
jgi:shikimate kinase